MIGAGKFGGYHASKYAAMRDVELVAIVDTSLEQAEQLAGRYGCQALTNVEEILDNIDAATIATPASTHTRIALTLLSAGMHVYIEKPLATNLEDADRMIAAAKSGGAIIQCGFQERYILSRLHLDAEVKPKRIECHRLSAWTGRGTDVDVALDLMIHDVDLVLQLTGGDMPLVSSTSNRNDPDELSAMLRFSDCTASLKASRKASHAERTMLLVYEDGTVYIDFLAGKIHDSRPINIKATFCDPIDGSDSAQYDPLGLAISDFVNCVKSGGQPAITADCGRKALALTLQLIQQPSTQLVSQTTNSSIPLFDISSSAKRCRQDLDARVARVLDHGQYIGGPEVGELEEKLARFAGVRHCLTTSSGTSALTIALMGESLSKNDAVFIPAMTYNATCNAVLAAGATPVFVDVDRETCNISAKTLLDAISIVKTDGKLRLAMVCPVDLYGKPAPYDELNEVARNHSMIVLADAAQSFGGSSDGKRIGSLADMTATSFYPSKTLGGFGDGGALFTNDKTRYETWKSIRWHGTDLSTGESIRAGLNGRMSTLQCTLLLSKLRYFEEEMALRERVATWYQDRLEGVCALQKRSASRECHANGLFTIVLSSLRERERVASVLKKNSIGCGVYYRLPLHKHTAFKTLQLADQDLDNAEWIADRVLSLPMSPFLQESQVTHVCDVVKMALIPQRSRVDDGNAEVMARL